jgi:hypothetical protein
MDDNDSDVPETITDEQWAWISRGTSRFISQSALDVLILGHRKAVFN